MNLEETLKELQALGNETMRKQNSKNGVGPNQYGVKLGDLRTVAKKIKKNHALALELWKTENFEARMLATLIIDPKKLSANELDALVRSLDHPRVADWLNSYVVKVHPDHEALRLGWMNDAHPMAARAGWNLTAERVADRLPTLDLPALLDRIEAEMTTAAPEAQWTMNFTLANIGIHHAELRDRALEIGERLGVYRDYPVSKGCTSPFAPIWIREMVRRQNS
jgi:3-methyladenine DNA glycosylase AlkD